jgi:hypothetical protein
MAAKEISKDEGFSLSDFAFHLVELNRMKLFFSSFLTLRGNKLDCSFPTSLNNLVNYARKGHNITLREAPIG